MYNQLIYKLGEIHERGTSDVVLTIIRGVANADVYDVQENEFVVDTATRNLLVRIGDMVFSYPASGSVLTYPSSLDFSSGNNSFYIGLMA